MNADFLMLAPLYFLKAKDFRFSMVNFVFRSRFQLISSKPKFNKSRWANFQTAPAKLLARRHAED